MWHVSSASSQAGRRGGEQWKNGKAEATWVSQPGVGEHQRLSSVDGSLTHLAALIDKGHRAGRAQPVDTAVLLLRLRLLRHG